MTLKDEDLSYFKTKSADLERFLLDRKDKIDEDDWTVLWYMFNEVAETYGRLLRHIKPKKND